MPLNPIDLYNLFYESGSLDYDYYIQHAHKLKLASTEVFKLAETLYDKQKTEEDEKRISGLFHLFTLGIACSIENIIKARALYAMVQDGTLSKFKDFSEVLNSWKGNGHDVLFIAKKFNIDLSDGEVKMIKRYLPQMVWAGRFPRPKKKEEVKEYESGKKQLEHKGEDYKILDCLINRLEKEMTD